VAVLQAVQENWLGILAIATACLLVWLIVPRLLATRFKSPDPAEDKRTQKIRESLSQYFAGVAVLTGVLISLSQSVTTSANFQQDFRERLHHDKRDELLTATAMLAGSSEAGRVSGVYSLAELIRVDPSDPDGQQISAAVFKSLIAFVRFRQSLEGKDGAENRRIPIDAQAAISVIGRYRSTSGSADGVEDAIDFSNLALIGADFRGGNFDAAKFMGSKLSAADFSGASTNGANFTNADLSYRGVPEICKYGTDFNPNDLWDPKNDDYTSHSLETNFSNASANGALFYSANLTGVRFVGTTMHGAKFGKADIGSAEFDGDTRYEIDELSQGCASSPTRPAAVGSTLKGCGRTLPLLCQTESKQQ
jgi:uncharacterized protein YjbI with pentapeptide repeats